jgi:hypothetical protein
MAAGSALGYWHHSAVATPYASGRLCPSSRRGRSRRGGLEFGMHFATNFVFEEGGDVAPSQLIMSHQLTERPLRSTMIMAQAFPLLQPISGKKEVRRNSFCLRVSSTTPQAQKRRQPPSNAGLQTRQLPKGHMNDRKIGCSCWDCPKDWDAIDNGGRCIRSKQILTRNRL